jgi:hypothetical protein
MNVVWSDLEDFAEAIGFRDPKDFKPQYLILSSVQGHNQEVTDPLKSIGIELIAPLALLAEVKEVAERAIFYGRLKRNAFNIFATGVGALSKIPKLIEQLSWAIAKLLPPEYQWLNFVLAEADLSKAMEKGAGWMRERAVKAAKRGDILTATIKYMSAELALDSAQNLYWSPLIHAELSRK